MSRKEVTRRSGFRVLTREVFWHQSDSSVCYCLARKLVLDWLWCHRPWEVLDLFVSKARRRAKLILRTFTSQDIGLLIRAYVVYVVIPHVEHNSIVWSPCEVKDIETIECVQRRFTKNLYFSHDFAGKGVLGGVVPKVIFAVLEPW